MSYTPPPTFVTGAYLSAAQLNILSDDIEYLRGQQLTPGRNFYRQDNIETVGTGTVTTRGGWSVMHLSNTFRYRIDVVQGTFSEIRILANGQQVFQENQNRSNPYTWNGTADITSLNLTEGAIYGIAVRLTGTSGTCIAEVKHLGEDWTNTGYSGRSTTTFNNNAVLTAAQLNALGTDIKFLYDRSLQPNTGFYSGTNIQSNSSSGAPTTFTLRGGWSLIHVSNTLFYRVKLVQGSANEWKIRMGGQIVHTNNDRVNGAGRNAPYEYEGTVDLTSFGFSLGTLYGLAVDFKGYTEGVNQLNVSYIGEIW